MLSYYRTKLNKNKTTPLQNNTPLKSTAGNKRVCLKCSLTVEASLGLFLIIFAMIILMTPIRIMDDIREANAKADAFTQTASALASVDADDKEDAAASLLFGEDDLITIRNSVKRRLPFTVFSMKGIDQEIVSSRRAWTGREGRPDPDAAAGDGEKDEWVWIVDDSDVYHRSATCFHIFKDFSTTSVEAALAQGLKACERCASGARSGTAYVLPGMHRFHTSTSCSAMNWKAHKVKKSEAAGRRPCAHCGG